jgi:hypothetical protein
MATTAVEAVSDPQRDVGAKRQNPLVIAGPKDIERGIIKMRDALFPGMDVMQSGFDLRFVEVESLAPQRIDR